MVITSNGKTGRDSNIETLSAKISTAANKRKAVCLDCGHTWEPRSSNTRKPSLCSKCKSRNCAWDDEIHTVKTAYSTAALMATVNGEPVTVEPLQNQKTEERQNAASTIASEVIRQLKEETEQTKPIVNSVMSVAGCKEQLQITEGKVESDKKLAEAVAAEVLNMIQESDNTAPKKSIKIKKDVSADNTEENDSKTVCEALRQVLGDDVQVIDKPIKKLSEDKAGETHYAVWQNDKGEIAYGVIVNPETFEEADRLLKEKESAEILAKTDENLERMNKGGLLDIETVLGNVDDEDDYEDEYTETNKVDTEEESEKDKKGVPIVAVLILGGVAIATLLPVINYIINEHKDKQEPEAKPINNENTPIIPMINQSIPTNLMSGNLSKWAF